MNTHPGHQGRLLHPKFSQQPSFIIIVYIKRIMPELLVRYLLMTYYVIYNYFNDYIFLVLGAIGEFSSFDFGKRFT